MRSEADQAYLANKHKGGEANAKGGLYEDCSTRRELVAIL
jgi:hypothetical protein